MIPHCDSTYFERRSFVIDEQTDEKWLMVTYPYAVSMEALKDADGVVRLDGRKYAWDGEFIVREFKVNSKTTHHVGIHDVIYGVSTGRKFRVIDPFCGVWEPIV